MQDSEKMMSLKKAYAEIILNTAKEAAMKIMVSERKANQYHHYLAWTKDEAIRLLVRIKQTMGCKLNDTETKSQNQQGRIDELEAQLQEAEDIVSDLRAELNEAHMRLEEIEKNRKLSRSNVIVTTVHEEGLVEPESELSGAVLASQMKVVQNAAHVHYIANNSPDENGYASISGAPSIIVDCKKPEPYRNGCTQRVRAYEGNLLNGHFPLSGELEVLKDEKTIREGKEVERVHMNPPLSADITCIVENKAVDFKEIKTVEKNSCKGQTLKSFCKKRKRAARYKRSNASILKPACPLSSEALSDLSHSQTCLLGSHVKHESFSNENKGILSLSPSTSPSNVSETGALPEHVAVVQDHDDFTNAHTDATNENSEVASSLVLIRQQSGSKDFIDVPISNLVVEVKNVSSSNSGAKSLDVGEGFLNPPPKDRVLKFTFQRKRRKEALNVDDSGLLPQKNPLKRKIRKKLNGPPKSSSAAESSRDNRRMAQVARQLISLSRRSGGNNG